MAFNRLPLKVESIKGPWFSLGFHVDLQRPYVDLHILWWVITIGRDYHDYELNGRTPPSQS